MLPFTDCCHSSDSFNQYCFSFHHLVKYGLKKECGHMHVIAASNYGLISRLRPRTAENSVCPSCVHIFCEKIWCWVFCRFFWYSVC